MLIRWYINGWSQWCKVSEFDYNGDRGILHFIESGKTKLNQIDGVCAVRAREVQQP